jgi:hypothetical protein
MTVNGPTLQNYINRVANTSIGSSTLRNQGSSGVVRIARMYLQNLSLNHFTTNSESNFRDVLNEKTLELQSQFPSEAKSWGAARKAINIFLGEIYYHRILCAKFKFEPIASFLEIPLDNLVANALRNEALLRSENLPQWPKIKYLDLEKSDIFQNFAKKVAKQKGDGWHRIHLDLVFWERQYDNNLLVEL